VTTLWDLLKSAVLGPARVEPAKERPWTSSLALPASRKEEGRKEGSKPPSAPRAPSSSRSASTGASSSPIAHLRAQAKYDALVELMCSTHNVRVRKWRTSMSGVAYILRKRDGATLRCVESPRPKGPMSAAVFLHEIGHHAIGLAKYKPRCLEEYLAWKWSLDAMREHAVPITQSVDHRVKLSLWYAADKALRRGLKHLPPELEPYRERPPRRKKRNGPRE
jgi:hypothetical protein